jgi:uncharacterized protein (DUF427 family)
MLIVSRGSGGSEHEEDQVMTSYQAVWNGRVIAESSDTVKVEGNRYFPADSVNREYLAPSRTHTTCPWKGEASYYSLTVDGKTNRDAAWFYPQPSSEAEHIRDHVAFWQGVRVQKVQDQSAPSSEHTAWWRRLSARIRASA